MPANLGGNVDHFYHFLFGLLLPFLVSQKELLLKKSYQFPDVGPMNRHLAWLSELGIDLEVDANQEIDKQAWSEITFKGWDHPRAYQSGEFELARNTLFDLMRFPKPRPNLEPRVLIVARGLANYEGRAKTSNGTSRRSIPNLPDLHSKLSSLVNVEFVVLEDVSLKDQIKLFSGADLVVAQHGASLSNLVWCKPSTCIIEVTDPQIRPPFFKALAQRLSLNYVSFPQASKHAEIDTDSLASIVMQKCREYLEVRTL